MLCEVTSSVTVTVTVTVTVGVLNVWCIPQRERCVGHDFDAASVGGGGGDSGDHSIVHVSMGVREDIMCGYTAGGGTA
jgi:hypothetical protein